MLRRHHVMGWGWCALLLAADIASKSWIKAHVALGEGFQVFPGLNFFHAHNHGAAFSLLAKMGGWQIPFLSFVAVVCGIGIIVWISRLESHEKILVIALSSCLAGALGNLSDRLTQGYVTDFIDVYWGAYHWYTFNIADVAISLGAFLLLWSSRSESTQSSEKEVLAALQNDEMVLHYQPQVDIASRTFVGAEALIRWNHPTRGLVMPKDFLPTKDGRLLASIDQWAVQEAFRMAKRMEEQGAELLVISVNVSSGTWLASDFFAWVEKMLQDTAVSPQRIAFEITENLLIRHTEKVLRILQALTDKGFTFSMDDFGTGYSSFARLKQLPFHTLKIDRSLVENIAGNSEKERTLVQAIIAMGKALGLKVLAEGVETEEQLLSLQSLGCDYAQGFYFSKALSEDNFRTLISS